MVDYFNLVLFVHVMSYTYEFQINIAASIYLYIQHWSSGYHRCYRVFDGWTWCHARYSSKRYHTAQLAPGEIKTFMKEAGCVSVYLKARAGMLSDGG